MLDFSERGVSEKLERILGRQGAPGSRFGLRRVWAQRESVASAVPDSVFMADSQLGQTLEIVRGSEQRKVLANALCTAHACSTTAMSLLHQVSELSLDLGSGRSVARLPRRRLLSLSLPLEHRFVLVNAEVATSLPVGASIPKRTVGAVGAEVGQSTSIGAVLDHDQHSTRTANRSVF